MLLATQCPLPVPPCLSNIMVLGIFLIPCESSQDRTIILYVNIPRPDYTHFQLNITITLNILKFISNFVHLHIPWTAYFFYFCYHMVTTTFPNGKNWLIYIIFFTFLPIPIPANLAWIVLPSLTQTLLSYSILWRRRSMIFNKWPLPVACLPWPEYPCAYSE